MSPPTKSPQENPRLGARLDRDCERYAARGYKRVEGWLSEIAVIEIVGVAGLQGELGMAGPVCEIGVHHGRTFVLLNLLTRPGEMSVAFDLYELQNERVGEARKNSLLENLRAHHGHLERVRIVTADSKTLTPESIQAQCGGRPRLFSIDGDRSAAGTYHDLTLAEQSICQGGIVSVTDYFSECWPEVSEGVCRRLQHSSTLVPVAIGGNKILFTTSSEMAALYRDRLAQQRGVRARRLVMYGQPILLLTTPTLRQRAAQSRLWQSIRTTPFGVALRSLGQRLLR